MRLRIAHVLIVVLGLASVLLPGTSFAQRREQDPPIGAASPEASTASKKPKKMPHGGRDKIAKANIKMAHEIEVADDGTETEVAVTLYDKKGNALKRTSKAKVKDEDGHDIIVDVADSTVTDTTLDVVTSTSNSLTGTSTDFTYDADAAPDEITMKKHGHVQQHMKHEYDADGRLSKLRSDLPSDRKLEGDTVPFIDTEFKYDASDNIEWIEVYDVRGGGHRLQSRIHQIYDAGVLKTKEMFVVPSGDPSPPEVLKMRKTYEYDGAGKLKKSQTFDDHGDLTFEETHTYDGDNEKEWTLVQPAVIGSVKSTKTKRVSREFDADGNLKTETTDETVGSVTTILKKKKVTYEKF